MDRNRGPTVFVGASLERRVVHGHGTWRLGALEAFRPDTSPADRLDETISTYQNDGYRTLVLAHQDHDVLPGGAWYGRIVVIVTLSERVKSDVAATVA